MSKAQVTAIIIGAGMRGRGFASYSVDHQQDFKVRIYEAKNAEMVISFVNTVGSRYNAVVGGHVLTDCVIANPR